MSGFRFPIGPSSCGPLTVWCLCREQASSAGLFSVCPVLSRWRRLHIWGWWECGLAVPNLLVLWQPGHAEQGQIFPHTGVFGLTTRSKAVGQVILSPDYHVFVSLASFVPTGLSRIQIGWWCRNWLGGRRREQLLSAAGCSCRHSCDVCNCTRWAHGTTHSRTDQSP